MMDIDDLTPDVAAEIESAREARRARLDAFAARVLEDRTAAVAARLASGIEDIWAKAEDDYLGIDDLNRHLRPQGRIGFSKAPTVNGSARWDTQQQVSGRATLFPRIAARYVDAGAAKIAEITIPIDGSTFALEPTPVPELSAALEDQSQVLVDGQPQTRPPTDEELQAGAPPEAPKPLTVADLAKRQEQIAADAAEEAEAQINDWLIEGQHARHLRRAIFDGARLGTMVIKGPIPVSTRATVVTKQGDAIAVDVVHRVQPATAYVSPWDLYPSEDCGESVADASYVLEVSQLGKRALGDLRGQPGYNNDAIAAVLKEGPSDTRTGRRDDDKPALGMTGSRRRAMFDVWHWYGDVSRADLEMVSPDLADTLPDGETLPAIVTIVNDRVIRAVANPSPSGRHPYRVAPWRRRIGYWAGIGVTEQCDAATALITAGTRALANNAGKSAGSIIVMDDETIIPADGSRQITPDKLYHKAPDATMEDVRKSFAAFQIPNVTPQLLALIEHGMKLAEDSTSIPLISQGMSGDTTPDTFGGQQLQNSNANQLLREIGATLAEEITEPLVRDMYEWLLADPEVPSSAKGDMQINVSGSLALVEKAIQDQTIAQMGAVVVNPAFGVDPKRWMEEYLRTKRLNPSAFQFSEAELEEMKNAPPPEAPQVTAAKIRAEAQMATAKSADELMARRIQVDTDRDTVYVQSQERRDAATYDAKMRQLELEREMADLKYRQALLDYATRKNIALDQAKVELAKTTMTLQLQKELHDSGGGKSEEVADPAVEPVGRAPDGEAFER